MNNKNKRILIGITGGIAAYKIPYLLRLLKKNNYDTKVVITRAAKNLVGEDTLRTISKNPVFNDDCSSFYDMNHIALAEWADYFVICPSTANTIAKIAHGIADNLLTTLALSFNGTVLIAPAMNTAMWNNPATQSNIAILRQRGIRVLPVGKGALACGDEGEGRMLSPDTIIEYIRGADLPQCFIGKKIVISSGPTVEPIDPVRVITNRSSGKMGAALAGAALCMAADVTVISGPAKAPFPEGVTVRYVQTFFEMADQIETYYQNADICIMAAAISDFSVKSYESEKISRTKKDELTLHLKSNRDISADLGHNKSSQFLVCFSLEMAYNKKKAEEKMIKKGCDMMVYNEINSSVGKDTSQITLMFPKKKSIKFSTMHKRECASKIMLNIAKAMGLFDG